MGFLLNFFFPSCYRERGASLALNANIPYFIPKRKWEYILLNSCRAGKDSNSAPYSTNSMALTTPLSLLFIIFTYVQFVATLLLPFLMFSTFGHVTSPHPPHQTTNPPVCANNGGAEGGQPSISNFSLKILTCLCRFLKILTCLSSIGTSSLVLLISVKC